MHAANSAMPLLQVVARTAFLQHLLVLTLVLLPVYSLQLLSVGRSTQQWCTLLPIDSTGWYIILPAMCAAATVNVCVFSCLFSSCFEGFEGSLAETIFHYTYVFHATITMYHIKTALMSCLAT